MIWVAAIVVIPGGVMLALCWLLHIYISCGGSKGDVAGKCDAPAAR